MSDGYFLWPAKTRPAFKSFIKIAPSLEELEKKLEALYPGNNLVLFSSARAGLNAILECKGFSRPDLVFCPKYSSHCVFDAISRLATPTTDPKTKNLKAALVYHQWGFTHKHGFDQNILIIEDAADTLFRPDAKIFACEGQFAICSLPKTYGTASGGIVFCKSKEDRNALKKLRDQRGTNVWQSLLRLLSKEGSLSFTYWNGAEATNAGLTYFERNDIEALLANIQNLSRYITESLKLLDEKAAKVAEKSGRIPCCFPQIKAEILDHSQWEGTNPQITTGYRNFNTNSDTSNPDWQPVAPIPIHKDVSKKRLNTVLQALNKVKSAA